MNSTEIVGSKKLVYTIAIGIVILATALFLGLERSENATGNSAVEGDELVAGSQEKFALLSGRGEQRSVGST